MAVLKMQHIEICALRSDRKQILERLQRLGSLEIIEAKGKELNKVFKKESYSDEIVAYEKNVNEAEHALKLLDIYAPEEKGLIAGFDGRKNIFADEYEKFKGKYDDVAESVKEILSLGKEIAERSAEEVKCSQNIETLMLWKGLDIPLNYKGTKYTSSLIGVLPGEWTLEAVYEKLADFLPVEVKLISATKEQACVVITCLKEKADGIHDSLKAYGFSLPPVSCELPPAQECEVLEARLKEIEKEKIELEEKVASFAESRNDIQFYSDFEMTRIKSHEAENILAQSGHTFIIKAFIAEKYLPDVEKVLADYDTILEVRDVKPKENAPVILSNNGFANPVSGVVSSYALPKKGEIDPSFMVACFYYIFFGLMLSDAMYGLLLTVGSGVLLALLKNAEPEFKASLRMFQYGGIATIFWGVIFGSYFGDLFDVIGQEFFGKPDDWVAIPPLWASALDDGMPMKILTLSLALGLIHLNAALFIKIYQCARSKDAMGAIADGLSWILFVDGLVVYGLTTEMLQNALLIEAFIPLSVGKVALILAIIGCLIILLFSGRSSKNAGKRALKGLYAVYGITGYLSDLLSYSRLLALGLATGVICSVANQLADMVYGAAPGIIGIILFIIVFLLMNTINLFINALGAYVHTNRLQYVEMFGKFYEGGGKRMDAFSAKTKYFRFKEN